MEKRLKKLLQFYCLSFLAISMAGAVLLQLLGDQGFRHNFLLSLRALSLSGGSFQSIITNFSESGIILLVLMEAGVVLWLFFSLQFANIIGQSFVFHNVDENDKIVLPATTILSKVLIYIFLLEAFSAVTLYAFSKDLSANHPVFWSVFNAVSIVTHAGFGFNLYSETFRESYIFQMVIGGLLIISRLGYPVFFDLSNLQRLRERMLNPVKNWTIQTRISIYITTILLLFGCVVFFLAKQNYLAELKIVAAGISTFFNVAGWQGAGFATVLPDGFVLHLLAVILMLAGLAPGSFGLLSYGLYASIFKNSKAKKVALTVLAYSAIVIMIGTFLIQFIQHQTFAESFLNSVSIFTNTGFLAKPFFPDAIYAIFLLAGRLGVPVVLVSAYLKFSKDEKPSELMYI